MKKFRSAFYATLVVKKVIRINYGFLKLCILDLRIKDCGPRGLNEIRITLNVATAHMKCLKKVNYRYHGHSRTWL